MKSFKGIALINFSYKIFGAALGFFTVWLLTNSLSKENFAVYTLLVSSSLLVGAFCQFGSPMFLAREVSRTSVDLEHVFQLRSEVIFFVQVLLISALLIGMILMLFMSGVHAFHVLTVFGLAACVIPNNINGAVYRGLGMPMLSLTAEAILRQFLLFLMLLLLLFIEKVSFDFVLLAYASSSVISFVLSGLGLRLLVFKGFGKKVFFKRFKKKLSISKTRVIAKGSMPFLMISSYPIINANLEIFMQAWLGSIESVASLKVAASITSVLSFGLMAISQISIPVFANSKRDNDGKLDSEKHYKEAAKITFLISLSFFILFSLIGEYFISISFGADYYDVYSLVLILSMGHLVSCFIGPAGLILNMTNNEKTVLKLSIVSLVINVVLMVLFIPLLGVYGAALSSALSLALWNILLRLSVKEKLGF